MTDRRERIDTLGYDYAAQPKQTLERCNLCDHDVFVVVAHRDRYGYPAEAHGCSRCGLVFLNPVMTPEAYAQFYDGVYRPLVSAYHGRLIDAETIQDEQAVYAGQRGELLAPFVTAGKGATLLDLGGSTGVVAAGFAERFGLQAAVLDPSPEELEHAKKRGLETFAGLLEEFDPGGRRFDVVTLCQTVDHLLDVGGSLAKIRELLTPDGVFFVDIVDLRAAYLRNHSVEEAIKIDHPYYLTEPTMRAYLRKAGFRVRRIDYAADHLHVGFVCGLADPEPENFFPAFGTTDRLYREMRWVQNAPRGG